METNNIPTPVADTTAEKTAAKKTNRKTNTPTDAINHAALAKRVAQNLVNYPNVAVGYMDLAVFTNKVTDYAAAVQARVDEQNARPILTQSIKELLSNTKKALKAVRGYLYEKYEDEKKAISFYPDFGLEKKGTIWSLPTDQQGIISAFKTLKKGLTKHGFSTKKFGMTLFTQLETDYLAAVNSAVSNDGSSSITVANKDALSKEINVYLTSVRFIVRGQYPTSYSSVLRDLGFQKEKM